MATIGYTKLTDGTWGIRVAGGDYSSGDKVVVRKRNGSTSNAVLGEEVGRKGGKFPARFYRIHRSDGRRDTRHVPAAAMSRDEADYRQGVAEVAQIQAISAPGSAFREELYLQMERNAYNQGLDY